MKLKDVVERIRFNTSTVNELSGKSINTLFTNKNIIQQLKFALDKYASYTKGIDDIYSLPLSINTEYIERPPLALKSETYKLAIVWIDNMKYMLNYPSISQINTTFRYQTVTGPPRWFIEWGDKIYVHPTSSGAYNTTTLASSLLTTDTTIQLTDGTGFLQYQGRITIGNEKILYKRKDGNTLYECERGVEQTTAAEHNSAAAVSENNMHFFYYRLHEDFTIYDNDYIPQAELNKELTIPDEHVEVITDYVSYKLLSKVDVNRAAIYKGNFSEWLDEVKYSVDMSETAKNEAFIRAPYEWETNLYPYLYNR